MRLRFAVFAAFLIGVGAVPSLAGADDGFVTGMDDVPLMTGLTEDPEARLVFDKPAGRIVEAAAAGTAAPAKIMAFYRRALPPLGWDAAKPRSSDDDRTLRFRRDSEILTLQLESEENRTVVYFSLAPARALP